MSIRARSHQWVEVPLFDSPYLAEDEGLLVAKRRLEERMVSPALESFPTGRHEDAQS